MIIENPCKEDVPFLRALWKQAFADTDRFLDNFFTFGFRPERALAVKEDGKPLAALYWFDCFWEGKRLAYLYAVATMESHRGKGLCRSLMEETHRRLNGGYFGTVLVPGEESLRALYEKFGYRSFGGMEEKVLLPGEQPEAVEYLTVEAYMLRRQGMLPPGSILQAGDTLPFLQTQMDFYGGSDWLLAGKKEADTFTAPEFLGNTARLPGILRTLDAKQGKVRAAGKTPFAMYRSLQAENALPSYFAFALDE